MALSTSELVADNPSASSVGGTSGTRPAFASTPGPGFGAWLVEARLAASPDIVRRGLFVLKRARVSNVPRRYNKWDKGVRHTFALMPRSGLHLFSAHGALRPLVGLSPQVRPSASTTSPAKFGCNQEIEHAWTDPYPGYWDFDLRYLGRRD